ncbi:MAG: replicative DNA helicase, partial [Chloroflexales bacterium]
MPERSVPFDTQAERATLGAVLLDREAIIAIASWLTPDHFYLEKHGLIYAAMLACANRREPPDFATVSTELRRQGQLDLVGGASFLGDLLGDVPSAVHIEYYARNVERTAILRRLIEAGGKVAAMGYDESEALEVTLDAAEQTIFAVSQRRGGPEWRSIGQAANEWYAEMERADGAPPGLPTGYRDLDDLTGGLQRSDLILLAARPGAGKTSLALSLAYQVAQAGATIGIISQEMSRTQLLQRMVAMHTGIDLQRLRTGSLRDAERATAFDALGMLSELTISIDDTAGLSVGAVRAKARRLRASVGCDLLIIDYLQLLVGGKAENRVQEVSAISRDLKALARELDAPVLALSQLNRAVEARASKVPMLSDLRESGSLEQDADIVLFIHREEMYDKETDKKGMAELHIAKHRNGPLGVVPLHFAAHTTRF